VALGIEGVLHAVGCSSDLGKKEERLHLCLLCCWWFGFWGENEQAAGLLEVGRQQGDRQEHRCFAIMLYEKSKRKLD
jgi:hypothetical protein